jgi:hypothetical protein
LSKPPWSFSWSAVRMATRSVLLHVRLLDLASAISRIVRASFISSVASGFSRTVPHPNHAAIE